MNLAQCILLRGAPLVLAVECRRCREVRPPGPDLRSALCARCQAETRELFLDETADGPVLGNA